MPLIPTTRGAPHINDMVNDFGAQFQGVTSFAQAITQAQQIEKFIKMDKHQKDKIRELKSNLNEFCQDFVKIDQRIRNVVNDKEQTEKILLELFSFGESCDVQYNDIIKMIKEFGEKDKDAVDKMKTSHEMIRTQLANTMKNWIVEIEDYAIRDELLSLLTSLDSQPLEKTVSDLVEKLIERVRGLLLESKRLKAINIGQSKKAEAETQKLRYQASRSGRDQHNLEKKMREMDILIQRIIIKIADSQQKSEDLNRIDMKRSKQEQINFLSRAKLGIDAILTDINLALGLISEWTHD